MNELWFVFDVNDLLEHGFFKKNICGEPIDNTRYDIGRYKFFLLSLITTWFEDTFNESLTISYTGENKFEFNRIDHAQAFLDEYIELEGFKKAVPTHLSMLSKTRIWCNENLESNDWCMLPVSESEVVFLKNESDAVALKLALY